MILIPYEKLCYQSRLSAEEIRVRLDYAIDQRSFLWFKRKLESKDYKGTFTQGEFEIQRISLKRDSFHPIIRGIIKEEKAGTKISIEMMLRPSALFGIIIWLIMMLGLIIFMLYSKAYAGLIIPAFMILLLHFMTIIPFNIEKERSTEDLQRILDAQISD